MTKKIVVHYHGDGGQCCTDEVRVFRNDECGQAEARAFETLKENEPGHFCGPGSVWVEYRDI